jgi:hypothetical protein
MMTRYIEILISEIEITKRYPIENQKVHKQNIDTKII